MVVLPNGEPIVFRALIVQRTKIDCRFGAQEQRQVGDGGVLVLRMTLGLGGHIVRDLILGVDDQLETLRQSLAHQF